MYELTLERFVHVTHALRLYDGQYEPMHHHRWLVSAQVSAPVLDVVGGVMDFNHLARLLDAVLAALDGQTLNQLPAFGDRNSSTESVAEYVFRQLAPGLPPGVRLDSVSLYRDEATRIRATYRGSVPPG